MPPGGGPSFGHAATGGYIRLPAMTRPASLIDGHGRPHHALRLSVTDRCNLRCRYCMPADGLAWMAREAIMDDDEMVRLTALLAGLGVRSVRVTGGEPLLRPGLPGLVRRVRAIPGIGEITLTTNGVLLAPLLDDLVDAGISRVTVSLDSLDPTRFSAITRRNDLMRVLEGMEAAAAHPDLGPVAVNAVLVRGLSEEDILPLATLARDGRHVVRFIETMPLDAGREWTRDQVIPGAEARAMIDAVHPLVPLPAARPSATATRWAFTDGPGHIEVIASVTEPFCASCDRLRLTADGALRTCLFAEDETDLLGPMRAGAPDDALAALIGRAVDMKPTGHRLADPAWTYAGRPMSRIGG